MASAGLRSACCVSRSPMEQTAYLSPILNILVPQVAHTPRVAGRPFFIWICTVLFISRFCLHFMQYASNDSPPH
jgi:hypothetical protein